MCCMHRQLRKPVTENTEEELFLSRTTGQELKNMGLSEMKLKIMKISKHLRTV